MLKDQGERLENCNYGLWFADVAAFEKYNNEYMEAFGYPETSKEKISGLMMLLRAINDYIGRTVEENESTTSIDEENKNRSMTRTRVLYYIDYPEKMTRSAIITAYYYYYNALHYNDGDAKLKGFENVYNDFKEGVDRHLEKAHFQLFSGRNIFDVAVAFSSYAYINL